MNKNKFYLFVIVGLLLSNILLIIYLMLGKGGGDFNPDKPRNIIIERLQFNDEQVKKYDALIRGHRKQIREIEDSIFILKNQLYAGLNDANPADSLTTEIARMQKKIETVHYNHFIDIKSLCTPNQLIMYKELTKEIANIFNRKAPKK